MRALRFPLPLACLLLLGAPAALATEAPPVAIRLPQDAKQAVAGEVYEGVFEIEITQGGVLRELRTVGKGWTVLEADLPAEGHYAPSILLVPFRARPLDPDAPLGLALTFDWQKVEETFALGPEAFAKRGARHSLLRRSGGAAPPPDESPKRGSKEGLGGVTLRVTGRIVYDRPGRDFDDDGTLDVQPVSGMGAEGIRVRLLDDDDIGSEEIWSGLTGPYGHFDSAEVFWDDCDVVGCDDPDLVLMVETDNGIVDVTDNSLTEDTYEFFTPEITDFTGSFHDFGTLTIETALMPALHIASTITRANRYIETVAGYEVPAVQVEWPDESLGNAGAVYESASEEIHVGSTRQWNEGTLVHEYGHHFLHAYTAPLPSDYCNNYCDGEESCTAGTDCEDAGHCVGCPENAPNAWNEGWPNWLADVVTRWMAVALVNDDGSAYEPWGPRSQEVADTCCQDDFLYTGFAEMTETFIGALLRDIEDDNLDFHPYTNDPDGWMTRRDMMCLGVDEIFDTVVLLQPTNLDAFLDGFLSLHPEHTADLRKTAESVAGSLENLLDLPADTQSIGPVVSAQSPSHPSGQGGYLPCLTFAWDAPADDVNGVCEYSYALGSTPAVSVDDLADGVGSLACQLARSFRVDAPGTYWLGIKAAECGSSLGGDPAVFGPFEVLDCNANGVIDLCDTSCDYNGGEGSGGLCQGASGYCLLAGETCGTSPDCQGNLVPDECDLAAGTSLDCNLNLVPDECEPVKHWAGGDGEWGAPEGWVEGTSPVSGDHVCIHDPGGDVTVSYRSGDLTIPILACEESLQISNNAFAARLTLSEPSWINGDLILRDNSSLLTVNDRLDVAGDFTWTGSNNTSSAKLAGTGTTHIHGDMLVRAGVVHMDHDLVLEPGTQSVIETRISTSSGSSLTVRPGATLEIQNPAASEVVFIGTGSTVHVEGVLRKTLSGQAQIRAQVVNDGTIHVQEGTLNLRGTGESTGTILADPATLIEFDSAGFEFAAGSVLQAERAAFIGGGAVRNVRGTYDVSEETTIMAPVTFHPEATILDYGTNLLMTGGETIFNKVVGTTLVFDHVTAAGVVRLNSGDPIVTESLTLGGTIHGPSPITVNGSIFWPAASTVNGPGDFYSNGTLTVAGGGAVRGLGRTLHNAGLAIFNAALSLQSTGHFANLASGTMDIRVDGTILSSASPTSSNAGTLVKTGGAATSTLSPVMTNTGTIESRTGTLAFRNLTQTAGQVFLNGGHLALTVEPLSLQGGVLRGSGTVTGTVDNSGGSVEPGLSAGTLTLTGSYLQGPGGRLSIELGGTSPGTGHDQLVLTGAASATLAGTLRVELIDGFVPEVGSAFPVLVAVAVQGTFDTLEVVGLPSDLGLQVVYGAGGVTLQVFDPDCHGVVGGGLAECPNAICPRIAQEPGGEPVLSFDDPQACPAPGTLPGPVDFVQGRLEAVSAAGGSIALGPVEPTACGASLDAFLWDSVAPAPGEVQWFLARPQGAGSYGSGSGGAPRLAGAGDCP